VNNVIIANTRTITRRDLKMLPYKNPSKREKPSAYLNKFYVFSIIFLPRIIFGARTRHTTMDAKPA